jgi:hypothetical protein
MFAPMKRILLPGILVIVLAACGQGRARQEEIRLLYEQQLRDDSLLARQIQERLQRPDSLPLGLDSLLFPFRFPPPGGSPQPDSLRPAPDSLARPQ